MSETMIERHARIEQEWEARQRKIKRALSNYQKQLKEPIYRQGSVEYEDGTGSPEIWEVTRSGKKIGEWPALWDRKDGTNEKGWCIALIVHEGLHADNAGWYETKIHTLYFDRQGELDHVMILNYSDLRHCHEERHSGKGLAMSVFERCGLVTTSLPS